MRSFPFACLLFAALLLLVACDPEEEITDDILTTTPDETPDAPAESSTGDPGSATPIENPAKPTGVSTEAIKEWTFPPRYETRVRVTPGEYYPSGAHDLESQKLREDGARPHFNGMVNGFRVYDQRDAHEDPGLLQKECAAVRFVETDMLEFGYLPAGTFARTPQYAAKCAHGDTIWVLQEFENDYASWIVSYELGERAIGTPYSGEYVKEVSVAGHNGVAIGPLIPDGAVQSTLALDFASGFLGLWTTSLPFPEMIAMAEGISCESC